ncbi:hypothetical protein [Nocardioides jensenii]|uniref:hypothetical protein n=1 Tax=Nocardioides jensenii TaxID=1843 RepID=UPI000831CB8A|nr:hypothetical protein [Nocardioides jensenii]
MSTFHRPALDVIADIRRGKLHTELTDAFAAVLEACIDTGKKGEVVLKLTFDPDKDDFSTRMKVTDQITTKAPRRTVKPSLFFLTDDGNLTRTDPNQEQFDGMRAVPATPVTDEHRKAN